MWQFFHNKERKWIYPGDWPKWGPYKGHRARCYFLNDSFIFMMYYLYPETKIKWLIFGGGRLTHQRSLSFNGLFNKKWFEHYSQGKPKLLLSPCFEKCTWRTSKEVLKKDHCKPKYNHPSFLSRWNQMKNDCKIRFTIVNCMKYDCKMYITTIFLPSLVCTSSRQSQVSKDT